MYIFRLLYVLLLVFLVSCKKSGPGEKSTIVTIVKETRVALKESDYRPNYHFTPPSKWMNDPNGMVYYKGQYHLFYQYNPGASVWGPMHWGHSTSTDLFNWKDHPIALAPDNTGTIFSGSAVADAANTSGFKAGLEDPLVAIYTLAGHQQHQAIAYSTNGGMNWTKYASNPVIPNPGKPDFRDPKVFWHAGTRQWIMSLAVGHTIQFYASPDLKSWTLKSSFGEGVGAKGGVWECPDLFQLPVEGNNGSKWVLLVSLNPGGPNGGSATQYFIGSFDGTRFNSEHSNVLWLDYGTDNYAGVTYDNIPSVDGRRVFIGWMSNWLYADRVPTNTWRSTMTIPRELSLAVKNGEYLLKSKPVEEYTKYQVTGLDTAIKAARKSIHLTDNRILKSGSYEIRFSADMSQADNLSLVIGNTSEKLMVTLNKAANTITLDRGASSNTDFHSHMKQKIVCPFNPGTSLTDFHILIDKTSIELFVNGGERVITALFFPNYQYSSLQLEGNGSGESISNFRLTGIGKSLIRN